jgi:hypothetical protein
LQLYLVAITATHIPQTKVQDRQHACKLLLKKTATGCSRFVQLLSTHIFQTTGKSLMSDQGDNPKDTMQNKMQITCGRVQIQDVRDDT